MRVILAALFLPMLVSANTLIIGVLGGWQRPDEAARGVRKLALQIRERKIPDVSIETFANHDLAPAMTMIRQWWSRTPHGGATIMLYGQSFGGAAVLKLAHQLEILGIPIALTVQIDSVGAHHSVIPPNVAAAANFFQREGWPLKGEAMITAQDPGSTTILGNYEYHYRDKKVDEPGENWLRRMVLGTHLKMESDPELWSAVERLIVARIR